MNDEVKPDFCEAKKKPKVKRPWTIEYRGQSPFTIRMWPEWAVYSRYSSEKRRDQAFDATCRKHKSFEFRKGNANEN